MFHDQLKKLAIPCEIPSSNLHVRIHRDFHCTDLRANWDALVSQMASPNIFLTWEWVTIWWKWFQRGLELFILSVWDGSNLVGILPAWRASISFFSGHRAPGIGLIGDGAPVCPEYLSPLIRDGYAAKVGHKFSQTLLAQADWKVIRFIDLPQNSVEADSIVDSLGARCLVETEMGESCYYHSLPSHYDQFLERLSNKRRKRLRQIQRGAEKQFTISLRTYDKPDQVERGLKIILEIYNRSSRGTSGQGAWKRSDYFGFHAEVATAFASLGRLRLLILEFDSQPVAFLYGYIYGGKFWFYQTAFHLNYAPYSPGSLILQAAIRRAIEDGLIEFDYLRGDESYKFHFANLERHQKRVFVFRDHGFHHLAYKSMRLIRRLAKAVAA